MMKNIKTLLITKLAKLTKNNVYELSKLPYKKIVILYPIWDIENQIKLPSKVSIIWYTNLIDLNNKINSIFKEYNDYKIIPYFSWDDNSKYSIKVYNKTFWTKVDPKIFKEKDKMSEFLWDIAKKKFLRYTYKELITQNYTEIAKNLWNKFIIKPTNASSSTNTFKVKNSDDFENIKSKISKTYDYILEEYIWWNLFSIDFFFDGESMYLLVLAREIAMIELSDKNKFSKPFIEKYWDELNKHFNFILPIAYHLDFSKLSKTELDFLENIRKKLQEINYRWVIHLEYKYDPKTKQLGFLEWWARYWGYRRMFMKEIYNTNFLRLPYYLLVEKDISRFNKIKWNIYKFKEKEYNLNFVRVKTNFIDKMNYIEILKKSWNLFESSFNWFLKDYYKNKFWINIKKIDFFVKYSKDYNFFPFYKSNDTKLDYILELNDENFKIFRKKKFKIIENIFFHDYNK